MHVFATVKPEQILQQGKTAYAETTAHVQINRLADAVAGSE